MPIDPSFVVTDALPTGGVPRLNWDHRRDGKNHCRGVAQFMHLRFNRRTQNELLTLLDHHGED